jgi:hypothetical protein
MFYKVRARLKPETADLLLAKLADGTIAGQKPDGEEIVAAMHRATLQGDGSVQWSEMCFCETPLAHERETVLDLHFDGLTTEPISAQESYEGTPFMDHLRQVAATD